MTEDTAVSVSLTSNGARFTARRPDGQTVEAEVITSVVRSMTPSDEHLWEFRLLIENGSPRGGYTEWTVSKVIVREQEAA